ncbi:MAG TPA: hypothetical protein VGC97_01070 [Pyrinomonadaceae bacterium]
MKTYRRIEITAFRRRVTIVSGLTDETQTGKDVCINNADTNTVIEPESAEGQRILLEAVRLLEQKLAGKIRKDA